MRPLRLEIQAFGPYARRQVLDFQELRGHALFLVHGPIGAGKTTILDALCFALYGVTSGGERSGRQMRCHQAPESLVTRCQLDFSLGRSRYRVERSPDLEQEGEARLWNLPKAGDPRDEDLLANNPGAVNRSIENLMGVKADQFCQAAVLPQGQFRRFLMASADQRHEILVTLFQTQVLDQFERCLEFAWKGLKEKLSSAWKEREQLVSGGQDEGDDFFSRLEDSQEMLQVTRETIEELRSEEEQTSQELEMAVLFRSLSEEREVAERELRLLESRENDRGELERRSLAESLLPLQRALEQARTELETTQETLETARSALARARDQKAGLGEAMETARDMEEEKFQLRELLQRLDEAEREFHELSESAVEMERLSVTVGELQEQERELEEFRERVLTQLDERQRQLNQSFEVEAEVRELRMQLEGLKKQLRRVEQIEKLRQGLEQMREQQEKNERRGDELERRCQNIREQVEQLEQARLRALAWQLAEELVEGKACPVCGSTEHPDPVQPDDGTPTISKAQQEHQTALLAKAEGMLKRHRRESADQELLMARMEERLGAAEEDLDEPLSAEELQKKVESDTRRLRNHERMLLERPKLKEQVAKLEKKRARVESRLGRLSPRLRQAETDRARMEGSLAARQVALEEEFESVEALEERRTAALARLEALEEIVLDDEAARLVGEAFAAQMAETRACELRVQDAVERVNRTQAEFQQALYDAGFLDEKEFLSALVDSEQGAADQELRQLEARLESARERLERAETALHQSQEPLGDLSALRRLRESQRKELESRLERKVELEQEIAELQRAVERYQQLVDEIHELEPRANALRKLAEVAQGDNDQKVTFHRFMLGRVLAGVLNSANRRLQFLTRGRYRLIQMACLELEVYDRRSGTSRPVATLSGGESFLASLSLALGLSDRVTESAGAGFLETVFIDEGFGNLDAESLDLSIQALMGLEQEGRLVGVISHVGELRERIRARLEVQPGPRGSSARLVLG